MIVSIRCLCLGNARKIDSCSSFRAPLGTTQRPFTLAIIHAMGLEMNVGMANYPFPLPLPLPHAVSVSETFHLRFDPKLLALSLS